MADAAKNDVSEDTDYELLPHKEIEDLRQELKKLKGFDVAPSKNLQVSIMELNKKIDKLISIFETAMHEVKVEEGGMSFRERMRPLVDKMEKVLEQNSEIAEGIVAVGDMVKELKESLAKPQLARVQESYASQNAPVRPLIQPMAPPSLSPPPIPSQSMALGPPPPRKRTFGL